MLQCFFFNVTQSGARYVKESNTFDCQEQLSGCNKLAKPPEGDSWGLIKVIKFTKAKFQ